MTRLKSFLVVLLMAVAFSSVAQEFDYSFVSNAKYDAKANKMVKDVKSSCNQGSEPFYKFIKKFESNKSFRKSRFKAGYDEWFDNIEFEFTTYKLKREWNPVTKCYIETITSFYNVSKNVVCYFGNSEDCEDGGSSFYRFKRINGKWYLVDVEFIG